MDSSFIELIKDIKRDDSVKNLEKNYQICVNKLKDLEKRKQNDKIFVLNSIIKEKSFILLKLLYLQMFGKKIDKEYNFSVIELLTCNKYVLKRRGYFFLNNINDNVDIIFLSINLFKKELSKENIANSENNAKTTVINSISNLSSALIKDNINLFNKIESNKSQFVPGLNMNKDLKIFNTVLILNSISNICTDIMSSNIYNDIFLLLNSSYMYIRKKAIICFYKLVISNLDILHLFLDFIKKQFISLYNNQSTSYEKTPNDEIDYTYRNNTFLCCLIINILAEIFSTLEKNDQKSNNEKYKKTNEKRKDEDEDRNNLDSVHSVSEYLKKFLSFIPFIYNILNERLSLIDNWKLIKIIKFLNKLIKYEIRIYKKFLSIIIHIFYTNKAKSIVFECFEFILFNYKRIYNIDIKIDQYITNNIQSEKKSTVNNNNVIEIDKNSSQENIVTSENKIIKENNKMANEIIDINYSNNFDKFLYYCFKQLLKYFFSEDKNIVYITTKLYKYVFVITDLYDAFVEYDLLNDFSHNILKNFYQKDFTIRKNLLNILYYLINKNNFQNIAYNIIVYLYNNVENDFSDEYINVILKYGKNNLNNMENINLYIFILFYILCLNNHNKALDTLKQILQINKEIKETHMTTIFLSSIFTITYGIIIIKNNLEKIHYTLDDAQKSKKNFETVNTNEICSNNYLDYYKNSKCYENNNIKNNEENRNDNNNNEDKKKDNISKIYCGTNDMNDKVNGSLYKNIEKEKFKIINNVYNDENYNMIIINDIYNFKKEFKEFEKLNKYDIFEYIIIILNLYDKINHNKGKCKYQDLNCIDVASFEFIIYFISIYVEEAYDKIKEFKNSEFLKIFFFSLYLFFINFSSSSILWNITKIFIFFYQFKENEDLHFYFQKLEHHINYLINKKNDVVNLDKCFMLKNILALLNNKKNEDTFNFYNYFTNFLEFKENDVKFNFEKPFKYSDSFFYDTEENEKKEEKKKNEYQEIYSVNTVSNVTDNNNEKNLNKEKPNEHIEKNILENDFYVLVEKQKEYMKIWKSKNIFFLIDKNEHFKLYFQINKGDCLLFLYIELLDKEIIINNFNLYSSSDVIKYDNILNSKNYNNFEFIDDDTNNFYGINFDKNNQKETLNDYRYINNENDKCVKKITNVEIFNENYIISLKYKNNISFIKLSYDYLYNFKNYENKNLHIPYANIQPLHLSVDEFKNVNKKNGKFRNMTYEIEIKKNLNINKYIFNYFLFLSEYLNFYFFNMKNIFFNFQNNADLDELRLIFCIKNSITKQNLEDKIILLVNVQHKAKNEIDNLRFYDVTIKMKILNDSEDLCNQVLNYFGFYLKKIFLQKIKIEYFNEE
ncbi:AP-3 complex subunit delta, putative [Plasmodium relictum]|uniref:AP-3 complex subunit delta, putative n=1 Tax=Plasmodium relictum TaxID=85471 RepID=A0A1J1H0L1_PLARL|nr:AP-3 complex subunit delta, putative [Plasmodium relictum]CRG98449.1 AP-3 complex subunit delta, putative [Plasmodium relictum]